MTAFTTTVSTKSATAAKEALMKNAILMIMMLSAAGLVLPVPATAAGGLTGNVNILFGAKVLEEEDWAPADEQDEYGIMFDIGHESWPLSVCLDLLVSDGDGWAREEFTGRFAQLRGDTREIHLGLRKTWSPSPRLRPYLGLGAAYVEAEAEVEDGGIAVSDEDSAYGPWLGGGVYWIFGGIVNVGFDMRMSYAQVEIHGVEVDAGGVHGNFFVGFHW